jgi:hypothetical protein
MKMEATKGHELVQLSVGKDIQGLCTLRQPRKTLEVT